MSVFFNILIGFLIVSAIVVGLIFCFCVVMWTLIEFLPEYNEHVLVKIMYVFLLAIGFCSSFTSFFLMVGNKEEVNLSFTNAIGFIVTLLIGIGMLTYAHRKEIAEWFRDTFKRKSKETLNENEEFAKRIIGYISSTRYYR